TETDQRAGAQAAELPLLSVSITWGVRRRADVTVEDGRDDDLSHYKVVRRGDLVINRMRAFQGALGLAAEDGIVSPDYSVLTVNPKVDSGWLVAAMKTTSFVAQMAQRVKGIGSAQLGNARTPRINVVDLGEIRLDVPSPAEQVTERSVVERQVSRIDALVIEAEQLINLSLERRSALITAAVTGQIDVREVA
ncbi:MAG: restriction endonuclease subunit S, partial [Actinomycetes bacterium]